jgi:hypothetical protein
MHPISRRFFIPVLILCFILSSCSTTPSTASPAPQTSPTAGQATTTMAPAGTMSVSTMSGTLDPCMLITTDEVTKLLGSAPAPTTGIHSSTGFHYCYFQTDSGILEVATLATTDAVTQFASANASFQSGPGYQKINAQGATIAFSGGPATNGNGTQGLVAAILKGNSLATVKLDSKIYTYNVDQASTLLETITVRLP